MRKYLLIAVALLAVAAVTVAFVQVGRANDVNVATSQGQMAAAPAFAQDDGEPFVFPPESDGVSATVDLEAGFILDPYLLRVSGSGLEAAANLDEACTGYVGADPDVVLNWSGETEKLNLLVYGDSDPILVVETPEGEFLCNDDAGPLVLDPIVTLEEPTEGSYQIYVGTAEEGDFAFGFLVVSEMNLEDDLVDLDLSPMLERPDEPAPIPFDMANIADLLVAERGVFGDSALSAGFETVSTQAAGGGRLGVFALSGEDSVCAGFVSIVPSYSFTWEGGGSLSVLFESVQDATLLISTPEGEVVCNDNAGDGNLNPAVDILNAAEGDYDIYIGAFEPNTIVPGILTITADISAEPETLSAESE